MKRTSYTVTQFCKSIDQPIGGFLSINDFAFKRYTDDYVLNEHENLEPNIIGIVVDHLTRYIIGEKESAFITSYMGACTLGEIDNYLMLLSCLDELNVLSIMCACELVAYDIAYKTNYKTIVDPKTLRPDDKTIQNIKIMVKRNVRFLKGKGPYKFGYSINFQNDIKFIKGEIDCITKNTLLDFKVSKYLPNADHTLQLMMYYKLGILNGDDFSNVKKIALFNPRLNCSHTLNIKQISQDVLVNIEKLINS